LDPVDIPREVVGSQFRVVYELFGGQKRYCCRMEKDDVRVQIRWVCRSFDVDSATDYCIRPDMYRTRRRIVDLYAQNL
jgi:hypothetical protein